MLMLIVISSSCHVAAGQVVCVSTCQVINWFFLFIGKLFLTCATVIDSQMVKIASRTKLHGKFLNR